MNQCDKHSYCCGGTDCDCNSGVNTITFDSYVCSFSLVHLFYSCLKRSIHGLWQPLPISDSGFPTFRAQNLSSTTTSIPVETSTASEQELSVTASDMTGFPTSQAQNLSSTTTSIPVETNTASEQELSVTASDMTGTSTTKSQKNSEISFSSSLRNLSTSNISKNKSTVLSSSTTSSSATPPPSLLPSSSSSSQEKSQDTIKISIGVCVVIAMLLIGLIVAFSIWRERRLKKHMRELRSRWVPTDYLSKTASANVPDSSARLTRNILDETCNTTPYHSFSDSIRQPETVERRSAPQELRISVATETWPAFHRPQNPDYDIGLIEAKSQTMKIHEQH